jgi:TatD DNase family protein
MAYNYIDIHSHLGFEDYGGDREKVIQNMQTAGVATIAIGADLASSLEAVKVAEENENVWACIGMHPNHNLDEVFDEQAYAELIKSPKVVAVGECGLDYYFRDEKIISDKLKVESYKEKQKVDFIKQIELAIKYDKPLMLHIRDGEVKGEAFTDAYNILSKYVDLGQGLSLSGNVHFFTGKLDIAQKFIALGFTVSFTGLITYVRDFDKVIRELPLENIQAETDAPYVAPVPYRGQRNEPAYVIEIYKRIAEIRGEDPETVRVQLLKNAKRVFHL